MAYGWTMLPSPPLDASVHNAVVAFWRPLKQRALRGENIEFDTAQIDKVIEMVEQKFANGELSPAFDWRSDISAAKLENEFNKSAILNNAKRMERVRAFWQERAAWSEKFGTQVLQELLKFALALHGGLAIACMTALASGKTPLRPLYVSGLFVSVVGFALMICGQIAITSYAAHYFGRLSGKLLHRDGWRFFAAISRWLASRKMRLWNNLAQVFIFGSLLLFMVYLFAFSLIVSIG